jgi:hypothetical protein
MRNMTAGCSLLLMLFVHVPAAAQSTEDARAQLYEGLAVSIVGSRGELLKGRITSLGDDGVTLRTRREQLHVPFADIDRIDRQKDGLLNGTLIGLGAGAALGAWAASDINDNYQGDSPFCGMGFFDNCQRRSPAAYFLGWTATGAAIGAGVDALIYRRDRTIYTRAQGIRLTAAPVVRLGLGGAALALSW